MRADKEKKSAKAQREEEVLLGLIEYFISTGKPVGSETLKEFGFQHFSSATIRNYFANLERQGFLLQHHTSGGRVPTDKGWRLYADICLAKQQEEHVREEEIQHIEVKEVASFLQKVTEDVSGQLELPAFISAPRFDNDYVIDIKLIAFEQGKVVAALLTSFGLVHTEVLSEKETLGLHAVKRIESYFRARLCSVPLSIEELLPEELQLANRFYQEIMARYLVHYSNFEDSDIFKAGFSKLLGYPEFQEAHSLISSLSLLENKRALSGHIRESLKGEGIRCFVGKELFSHLTTELNCSLIMIPYMIGPKKVGSIGVVGPLRMNYRAVFSLLQKASHSISQTLTESLMKYQISYRTPSSQKLQFTPDETNLLLEDKRE